MRNSKLFSYLIFFFIFSGLFIQSQGFSQNKIKENSEIIDNNIRNSGPTYPDMTMVEWELLECPGDDRHIIMYIPDSYDPDVPSAVIWSLHGMVQHIDERQLFVYEGYIQGSECYQVASYGNAIVIVPQGYNGPIINYYGWDSSNPNPDNEDVEFFRWFIEDFLANNPVEDFGILNINRRRIYIGGYSMGGMINTCAGKIRDGQHYAAMYHIAGGKYFDDPLNVTRKYPAHVVIGSEDTTTGDSTQTLLNTYITENHPYYYQEYPGIAHMDIMHAYMIDPFHSPQTYFEVCWDWLVQWALNEEAILLNSAVEEYGDYHKFSVEWKDSDNDDPIYQMAVVIDDVYYDMEKEDPNDLDSTDGCIYTCEVPNSLMGNGTHYYYFEGIEGDHYGIYSIIEAGQGPYNLSIAKTDTNSFSVNVINIFPTVDFEIDKTKAEVGEEIHFNFTGSGGNSPTEYLWNFGNGYTSIEKNPTHVYDSTGNFTVSLLVTDYDGDTDFLNKTDAIEITDTGPEPPLPEDPVIHGFPIIPLSISFLLCLFGLLVKEFKRKIIT